MVMKGKPEHMKLKVKKNKSKNSEKQYFSSSEEDGGDVSSEFSDASDNDLSDFEDGDGVPMMLPSGSRRSWRIGIPLFIFLIIASILLVKVFRSDTVQDPSDADMTFSEEDMADGGIPAPTPSCICAPDVTSTKTGEEGSGGDDCASIDQGKPWCYVVEGKCRDGVDSESVPDYQWSFHACYGSGTDDSAGAKDDTADASKVDADGFGVVEDDSSGPTTRPPTPKPAQVTPAKVDADGFGIVEDDYDSNGPTTPPPTPKPDVR